MPNRIKEFRTKKGLTQKDCVKAFNRFLKRNNVKGITSATFSRWENGKNSPTDKMWDLLAKYMGTTSIVLQGAIGLDEVVEIIQKNYIDTFNHSEHEGNLFPSIYDFLAGIGQINLKQLWLDKKKQNDFSFWRKNFAKIFLYGQPIIWLITTKPVNLDLYSSEALIRSALDSMIRCFIKYEKKKYKHFESNIKKMKNYLIDQTFMKTKNMTFANSYLYYLIGEPRISDSNSSNSYHSSVGETQYLEFLYPNPADRKKYLQKELKEVSKFNLDLDVNTESTFKNLINEMHETKKK